MKEKFGILGTADIAYRRFLPALKLDDELEYIGVATRYPDKAEKFVNTYGGRIFEEYRKAVEMPDITSMYIPLPPSLHYVWGMACLENNKHVFMEKPCAISFDYTMSLVNKARNSNLVLYENYGFLYHKQLAQIKKLVWEEKILGDIRLIRINFSFPRRQENDFRYNKELGGGALLDCGGYTVRLAVELLGKDISVDTAKLNYVKECDVDMYGTATLQGKGGCIAQLAFGMDNGYKCEMEVIGQKGWVRTPRIFTAPADCETMLLTNINNSDAVVSIGKDNQFLNAIKLFKESIHDYFKREKIYEDILCTARLVEELRKKG